MNFLKDILYSVIIVPFTAGNGFLVGDGLRVHDGTISSFALTVFLIGIGFSTLIFGTYRSDSESEFAVKILLVIIVLAGIVALLTLWAILRQQNLEDDLSHQYQTDPKHSGLRLFFLCLFCVGFIARTVFGIYTGLHNLSESRYLPSLVVRILWSLILFVFSCIQTAFISCFRKKHTIASLKIHYGMIFVVAANISIWFESILQQEENIFHSKTDIFISNRSIGLDTMNCTNLPAMTCFVEKAMSYLSSILAAYCISSIGFVLGIWSTATKKLNREISMESSQNFEEARSLLYDSSDYLDIDKTTVQFEFEPSRKSSALYFSVGIGVLFVIILVTLVLVLMTQTRVQENTYMALEIHRLSYMLFMLFLVFLSFRLLWLQCTPVKRTHPISASEYILLFSCLGRVVYLMLEIYSETNISKEISWTFPENFISLVLTYFQTVLIIQANRYLLYRKLRFFSIKNVFILLFVLNIGLWLNDSFLQNRVPYITQKDYTVDGLRTQEFVKTTLFPVIVYYRFQCSMLFYELHYNFRSMN